MRLPVFTEGSIIRVTVILVVGLLPACSSADPATTGNYALRYSVDVGGGSCGAVFVHENLLICDAAIERASIYDASGRRVKTLDLPAGVDGIQAIYQVRGDSAILLDRSGRIAVLYDAEGDAARTLHLPARRPRPVIMKRLASDGTMLMASVNHTGGIAALRRRAAEEGWLRDSVFLARVDASSGEESILLKLPLLGAYSVRVGIQSQVYQHPFQARTLVSAGHDHVAFVADQEPAISIMPIASAGEVEVRRLTISPPDDPRPDEVWESFLATNNEGTSDHRTRLRQIAPEGEGIVLSEILVADDGSIWVGEWVPPADQIRRWHVYRDAGTDDPLWLDLPASWSVLAAKWPHFVTSDALSDRINVAVLSQAP